MPHAPQNVRKLLKLKKRWHFRSLSTNQLRRILSANRPQRSGPLCRILPHTSIDVRRDAAGFPVVIKTLLSPTVPSRVNGRPLSSLGRMVISPAPASFDSRRTQIGKFKSPSDHLSEARNTHARFVSRCYSLLFPKNSLLFSAVKRLQRYSAGIPELGFSRDRSRNPIIQERNP
jgi:hypothetical protein